MRKDIVFMNQQFIPNDIPESDDDFEHLRNVEWQYIEYLGKIESFERFLHHFSIKERRI